MQTKPKSNSVVTHTVDPVSGDITFQAIGAGSVTLKLASVSDVVKGRAMRHGLIQRVSDAAAISRNSTNGQPATPATKLASMARLVDHYNSGAEGWSPERVEGSGPGLDTLVIAAVMEATGRDEAAIRAMVAKGAEEKKITPRAYLSALAGAKLVAPIVDRMRAEVAGVSGDDLIADMSA